MVCAMKTLRASLPPRRVRDILFASLAVLAGALLPAGASAATVTVRPSKDTTLYGDGTPSLSNGAGAYLFAGSSGQKRGLLLVEKTP